MYKSPIYFAIFLFIVFYYHYYIQNNIEKRLCLEYFGYNNVKRPLSGNTMFSYGDLGMPSGHSETITIFATLLYLYKFIPLWLCILLISIVGLQRILTNVHTIMQVIAGIFIGFLYAKLYRYFNLSVFSFLIVLIIGLILSLLIIHKIDKDVYTPIISWVDPEMLESIKKNKMLHYIQK